MYRFVPVGSMPAFLKRRWATPRPFGAPQALTRVNSMINGINLHELRFDAGRVVPLLRNDAIELGSIAEGLH